MNRRRRNPVIRTGRVFRKRPNEVHLAVHPWLRITTSILFFVAAFLGLFGWFFGISASPDKAETDQSILIFTDSPGVPLHALVSFDEVLTDTGEVNSVSLSLIVDGGYQGDSVGVSIAFQGEGFRRPDQQMAEPVGDCSLEVEFYGTDISPACSDGKNLPDVTGYYGLNKSQVLSGTLTRTNNAMHTNLTVYSTDDWSSSGTSRTAFYLPRVGSGYREPDWPPTEEAFGTSRLFDPDLTNLTVTYRWLASDEKIEIVSPEPSDPSRLHWNQQGNGSIVAHGSTVLLGSQERQSNQTFLIGVLAGLVPLIGSWIYKQLGQPAPFRRTNKN
jgi:hypothetical protein